MGYRVEHVIQGKKTSFEGESHLPIYHPASGKVLGETVLGRITAVNQAVSAAKAAFPAWSQVTPAKRARILMRFGELLERDTDSLAHVVTEEHGKTLPDAKGSIARGIELVHFLCGLPELLKGAYSSGVARGVDCHTIRQPLGVCVGISPFNFPVMVPIWQFVSAIACGNTFVLKPSEQDPSASVILADLMTEAGMPPGVLNIVQGDKTTVTDLITHPDVMAVTAVASTPVAQSIYQTAISQGKRAHTFGGAKNHAILMPDADLSEAADALLGAAFGSAGERCMAISVVVAVGEKTADALVMKLKQGMEKLVIGDGKQSGVDIGPLISQSHREKVLSYIEQGVEEGAKLVVDGRSSTFTSDNSGYFLGASLFDHVEPRMRIYQEEIFGPVLCIVRVNDFESALSLVNSHRYGNGAAIFTRNGEIAQEFAERVQAGMVGINIPIPVPVASHPFGGWKASIFGDLGMHGHQSLQFYTKSKSITTRWPEPAADISHFVMPTHD